MQRLAVPAQGAGPRLAPRRPAGRGARPAPHRPGRDAGPRGRLAREPRRSPAERLARRPDRLAADRGLPREPPDAARAGSLRRRGAVRGLPSRGVPGAAGLARRCGGALFAALRDRPGASRIGRARPIRRDGHPRPASGRRRLDPPGDDGRRAGVPRPRPVRLRLGRSRADPRRPRPGRPGFRASALRLSRVACRIPGCQARGAMGRDLRPSRQADSGRGLPRQAADRDRGPPLPVLPPHRAGDGRGSAPAPSPPTGGSVASGATGRRATTCWPSKASWSSWTQRSPGRQWPRAARW